MKNNPDKSKSARQLRQEREKRVMDAVQLTIPDRIPVMIPIGYFPAKYVGVPYSAAYYDFDTWFEAYKKTLTDFQPDAIAIQGFTPGTALEIMQPKTIRWPGYGVDEDKGHQSIEVDNMKADELDAYMEDTSDYMFRTFMSRTSEISGGLSQLPRLANLGGGQMGLQQLAMAFSQPDMVKTIRELQRAGRELKKWHSKMMKFDKMILDMGFFQYSQGAAMPPYDVVSHSLRGMQGTMFDMYRQPDKLIELCEFILEQTIKRPLPPPSEGGHIRYFMTNTRGSDDFLSVKQFEKFYWPTFKKLVDNLIERGVTPFIFFEGKCDSRMEYMLDFPKGKLAVRLDSTDIFRAKDILKDHVCIEGNVPSTLLQTGTPDDVKAHVKKLIDVVGKDGGYIMSTRSSTDHVKPENLKAMIDFSIEYGVYR